MPTRDLPENPSLEWLKKQAKSLHRDVRAGDPDARALVAEFDPRTAPEDLALTGAQLVIARSYGFSGWAALREQVLLRTSYTRFPEPPADLSDRPDAAEFLRLACLNYTRDLPENPARARRLLAAHPQLATADVFTMAAAGEAEALERLLAEDPGLARRTGGPFEWEPLMYLAYGRVAAGMRAARALLAAGADPNAGYLWHGMISPFTALTGVLGGGEQSQPPHPEAIPLARLLLEAGADPNDNQALYNRMFEPANDHLELLFEFGLGTDVESPWRKRLGANAYPSAAAMVQEQLRWAADHEMADRVRLLLAHGVDPDGRGYHPNFGEHTAYELAVLGGNRESARLLAAAGARTSGVDEVDAFVGACLAGDRELAQRLAADPETVRAAIERQPDAVAQAVRSGRMEAVVLTLEHGFAVSGGDRTGLHEAAHAGNEAMVTLLLERGADPTPHDSDYGGTPADWAEHGGYPELAARLRVLE
ncbi:MAG TPA: ankyrin repeat domain-containing protein [Mycobacteriales bacterium]|nr:ankyrin repeat domain-containing protein [Mycobacteriales bacterium]